VLSDGPTLEVAQLPAAMRSIASAAEPAAQKAEAATPDSEAPLMSYEEEIRRFKRNLILRTLRECGWRKAESARALGVARGYLHRLINQLGIQQREGDPAGEDLHETLPFGPVM